MYCVECGSEQKLFGKVCLDCLKTRHELVTHPSHLKISYCGDCLAVLKGQTWRNAPLESVVEELLSGKIAIDPLVRGFRMDVPPLDHDVAERKVDVILHLYIDDTTLDHHISIQIRTNKTVCDMCSRHAGSYYEAIIQVRADVREPTHEELQAVGEMIESRSIDILRVDRTAFVTKITDVKGGKDYYMGSAQSARGIARELVDRFGAGFSETTSQAGFKDGRETLRYTFLIRLPRFKKGDFVTDGKRIYNVAQVRKKDLLLRNLADWKNVTVSRDSAGVLRPVEDPPEEAVVVSQSEKELQVLDPWTLKTVDIIKPLGFRISDSSVLVIRWGERLFLVASDHS